MLLAARFPLHASFGPACCRWCLLPLIQRSAGSSSCSFLPCSLCQVPARSRARCAVHAVQVKLLVQRSGEGTGGAKGVEAASVTLSKPVLVCLQQVIVVNPSSWHAAGGRPDGVGVARMICVERRSRRSAERRQALARGRPHGPNGPWGVLLAPQPYCLPPPGRLLQEAGMMAALRHPNVVQLLGVCMAPPVRKGCTRRACDELTQCALLFWRQRPQQGPLHRQSQPSRRRHLLAHAPSAHERVNHAWLSASLLLLRPPSRPAVHSVRVLPAGLALRPAAGSQGIAQPLAADGLASAAHDGAPARLPLAAGFLGGSMHRAGAACLQPCCIVLFGCSCSWPAAALESQQGRRARQRSAKCSAHAALLLRRPWTVPKGCCICSEL